MWPAQRPVVGVEAGRRPVGRPAIAQPAGPPVLFRRQSARARSGQRDEQAPRADSVRGKRTSGRIPSALLLRNDLGTLVDRYRRFCIVARGELRGGLPLSRAADQEQKLDLGLFPLATWLLVRGTRSVRVSLGCLSLPSTAYAERAHRDSLPRCSVSSNPTAPPATSNARERLAAGMSLAHACGATALLDRAHDELLIAGARSRGPR